MSPGLKNLRAAAWGPACVLVFLLAWEGAVRGGWLNPQFIPAPSQIVRGGADLAGSGQLTADFAASLGRAALGFVAGGALGILVGIATAKSPVFRATSGPFLKMAQAIPSLAFVPLTIFWFGLGESSKVFLVAWGVFFPVWINTSLGIRDVNPLLHRAALTLGASGWRQMAFVTLPASLPMILAGLRVGLSLSLVLLVAAELAGAQDGLGYLIQSSEMTFRVDDMFVGLLGLGLLGLGADLLFSGAVRRIFPWYGGESRGDAGPDKPHPPEAG